MKDLHEPGVGSEGPYDDRIAAWYGESFIVDSSFNSTNELRELADKIDKWRNGK